MSENTGRTRINRGRKEEMRRRWKSARRHVVPETHPYLRKRPDVLEPTLVTVFRCPPGVFRPLYREGVSRGSRTDGDETITMAACTGHV